MNKYASEVQQYLDAPYIPEQIIKTLPESELASLELELGHQLPSDYREFIRDYGGLVTYSGFSFPADHELSYRGCEIFFGVFPETPSCDLVHLYQAQQKTWQNWPSELLPIGAGDNGYVGLILSGLEKGAIYFWRTDFDSYSASSENLFFVTNSFDQFLPMLAYQ